MTYEYVSQFFMLLLALLVGAFLGCMLRRWTCSQSKEDAEVPAPSQSQTEPDQVSPVMESAKIEKPVTVAAVTEEPPASKPVQARGLEAAIDGKADDLKIISGIGPKLEKTLNGLGIFHFEQIAGWSAQDVSEVDDLLSFKGRIERDDWIAQAKKLMKD